MTKKKTPLPHLGRRRGKEEQAEAAPAIAETLGQVAQHFGVSINTLKHDWRPNWGDSCGGPGAWNLDAIAEWRALSQSRSPGAAAATDEDVLLAQKRKVIADARIKDAEASRKERLNRLAEAGVVFREDVEAFLSEFFRFLRDGIKGLIEDSKPEFPGKIRQQLADGLQQRASALLRSLKNQAEKLAELDDAA